jgi:hypothetical protein
MKELDQSHHFFRHIKKSWTHGDFVEPTAFRLRMEADGGFERGLSINWFEYFQTTTPQEAITPLRNILVAKGRTVGGESKFAFLNVRTSKTAAAAYTPIAIVPDKEENDPSHALVKNYEAYNDQVAEELSKVIIAMYPAKTGTP